MLEDWKWRDCIFKVDGFLLLSSDTITRSYFHPEAKVAELIDMDTHFWRLDLLRQSFMPHDI